MLTISYVYDFRRMNFERFNNKFQRCLELTGLRHPRDHPRGHPRDHPRAHPRAHPRDHPHDHPRAHPRDHPHDHPRAPRPRPRGCC